MEIGSLLADPFRKRQRPQDIAVARNEWDIHLKASVRTNAGQMEPSFVNRQRHQNPGRTRTSSGLQYNPMRSVCGEIDAQLFCLHSTIFGSEADCFFL